MRAMSDETTATIPEGDRLTIELRTSLAGTDDEGRPFSKGPTERMTVPRGMALALADGQRAVLIGDDDKPLTVPAEPEPGGRRETTRDKRSTQRETAQPPTAEPETTGNEVADRKRAENLEQLEAGGGPVESADDAERKRRTSRPRRKNSSS